MIKIDSQQFSPVKDEWYSVAGFVMLQLTGVLWSYYALRPYKKTTVQE